MTEGRSGTSSAGHGVDDDDFFTLDDFVKDADNNCDVDGDVALDDPEDAKLFVELQHRIDESDDLVYGTPR